MTAQRADNQRRPSKRRLRVADEERAPRSPKRRRPNAVAATKDTPSARVPRPSAGDASSPGAEQEVSPALGAAAPAHHTHQSATEADAPSMLARGLGFLAPALPEVVCRQLLRLLSHSIAAPTPQLLRDARLGLLVQMLRERGGELVGADQYDAERRSELKRGRKWPTASTIGRAFGDWRSAVLCAMHLAFLGLGAHRAGSLHHAGWRPPYTQAEVIEVLIACRDAFNVWLLGTEYYELRTLRRRAARAAGLPEPRMPSREPIDRLFGNYSRAVDAARRAYGDPVGPELRILADLQAQADVERNRHGNTAGPLHPLADRLWELLRDGSEADLRLVYAALTRRLRHNRTLRADLCLRALRCCQVELGIVYVSRRTYDGWLADRANEEGWPASSFIRRTYGGSWPAALEDLGVEPEPDVLVRRMLGTGDKKYARKELLEGVRICASEHPAGKRLRFLDYKRWAQRELHRRNRRFQRLALCPGTFNSRFGSWAQTLVEAGAPERAAFRQAAGCLHGTHDDYNTKRLKELVHEAAASLRPGIELTPRRYITWAREEERVRNAGVSNNVVVIPSYSTIRDRFGGWAETLRAAGVIDEAAFRRRRHRKGVQMSREQLVEMLRRAVSEIGGRPTKRQYDEWREELLGLKDCPPGGVPHHVWLAQELGEGSWRQALDLVS